MASPGMGPAEPPPEPAVCEAQKWVEQATGRSFGDKDFRSGLENGILLCELLNAIKPGLVKKINRLPTPIAGLDNIIVFLRGCKELGLKDSQLFDPGDLQDTSNRATFKSTDYNRKLKNVLVTIYWLGKAANSCTSYSGAILNLKEFEGLLAQMRKETDDIESPKRNIRDSGYIDCWDSERSDSLSPPRHGRDDSFDSLDSFGSRSQQTPSPDVVFRGSSDGRGSDSESDLPHRRIPDVRKDDMSARRVSYGENKAFVPFNQYLPNKSNQTAYIPAPLRKKKAEREEYRKSWSTVTSPLGGERPFSQSHPEPIKEETNEVSPLCKGDGPIKEDSHTGPGGNPTETQVDLPQEDQDASKDQTTTRGMKECSPNKQAQDEAAQLQKIKRMQRIGIKVMPAAKRYSSQNQTSEDHGVVPTPPEIILHKENTFLAGYGGTGSDSEEEDESRVPDIEKDDLAIRRIRLNQTKTATPVNPLSLGLYTSQKRLKREDVRLPPEGESERSPTLTSSEQGRVEEGKQIVTRKDNPFLGLCENESEEEEEQEKIPDIQRDDLAKRKTRGSAPQPREPKSFMKASITKADLETWERLKVSTEMSDEESKLPLPICKSESGTKKEVPMSGQDDRRRKAREPRKRPHPRQKFVHFGPVTEIDQKGGENLDIAKPEHAAEAESPSSQACTAASSVVNSGIHNAEEVSQYDPSSSVPLPGVAVHCSKTPSPSSIGSAVVQEESPQVPNNQNQEGKATEDGVRAPDPEKDDMMTRRTAVYQKQSSPGLKHFLPVPFAKQKEDLPVGPTRTDKQLKSSTKFSSCTLNEHKRALPPVRPESPQKSVTQPQPIKEREDEQHLEVGQCGQHALQHWVSPQKQLTVHQILPDPSAKEAPETSQNEVLRFSPRTALSDDAESMSMFDMRSDDTVVMQPHSRVHQEQLQNVNNLLKEEDDQWQDDLARWKNRRRSASQDLIKKEQERKKMEKVLSGEDGLCERRKSIKTYKEIVEEKERREKELHEAYKNAKSREDAEKILQKYIERFTISEAVLERLEMPKTLERSHSVEPNSLSIPEDPNPMKYLRQQSLPAPVTKFTATVEATIVPTSESETRFSTGRTSPNKTVSKAVPLLVPKPYSQPNATQVLRTFKVDSKVSMNGDSFIGMEDGNEDKCATGVFAPSLGRSQMIERVARVDGSPEEMKQESTRIEMNLQRTVSRSLCKDVTDFPIEEMKPANQTEENNSGGCVERKHPGPTSPEVSGLKQQQQNLTKSITADTNIELGPHNHCREPAATEKDPCRAERDPQRDIHIKQKAVKSQTNELEEYAVFEFFKKTPEASRVPCQNVSQQVDSNTCEKSPVLIPSLNSSKRVNFWSWDPDEERKRQEKWQQEQERLLQERYQKEQEKLKEEWEKAQKEVEEEERKYYEEERKIIEDTVVPFTVSSSSTEPFSSCSSSSLPEENRNVGSVVRPVPEMKQEKEVAENQTCLAGMENDGMKEKQPKAEHEKHNLLWDKDSESLLSNGRGELWQEEKSKKEVTTGSPEIVTLNRIDQGSQVLVEERRSPARMQLQLHDAPRTPPVLQQEAPVSDELSLKASSLNPSPSLQIHTSGGMRRIGSHENIKDVQSSPCSPTPQCQSPSRSVSGKKLCSTCGLPLGKGAAMIIETLNLCFHLQCFRCGICKGQLGDTTAGTDVRIRNGLLNCNDCYIRSRTAGQPTTL